MRIVWLFFFDKNKPDLTISVSKKTSKDLLPEIVENLKRRYSQVQVDYPQLRKVMEFYLSPKIEDSIYATDCFTGVFALCFPYDIRNSKDRLVPYGLRRNPSAPEIARSFFHHHYAQLRDRY